ncbi:uncharacterized protein LOC119744524 isoform X2 [Patiria miniata]|uniref:Uncharacterized protein n=1 Tax=Patiria miniata TaxID=46514 RepID=A0A914BKF9_PATMI|nr:uncharacterized protein LOC119744524 isoform X2 [Patiria miniata]
MTCLQSKSSPILKMPLSASTVSSKDDDDIRDFYEAQNYQEECTSLDQAVQQINDQAQLTTFGGNVNCSRNADCTGLSCMLTLQGERTELRIKLHPCDDPPQMYLLIQDPDTNLPYVEQTVTHGDTYDIPGLHFTYMDFLTVSVAIGVQFEQVSGGFRIGLNLIPRLGDTDLTAIPLLTPIDIATPPCTTQGPESLQCIRMRELVEGLRPPYDFQCLRNNDCRGFSCSGVVQIDPVSFPVSANSVLDSCTVPISYNITLRDGTGRFLWSHSFIHSEEVIIQGDSIRLPPGVVVKMNVTMDPVTEDIDYLLTTIRLKVYCGDSQCGDETFLQNDRVPIPPCDHPMPTSTRGPTVSLTPIPGADDECSTFQAIATDIMKNEFFVNYNMECQANRPDSGPCDGLTCNMTSNGNDFVYKMKLFQCETPVRLLFTVDNREEARNYHLARNVSGNDIVPLDGVQRGLKIKIVVVKRMNGAIELALTLQYPISSGLPPVPLVQDRLVPVAPCTTTMPGPTDSANNPTKVTKPAGVTDSTPYKFTTGSAKVTKPGANGSGGGGGGKGGKSGSATSNKAMIAIPVVVVAIVVVAVVILAAVWYRRRSRRPNDHINLIENTTAPM